MTPTREASVYSNQGFTLIEVMVALAIMAVLGLLASQAMRSGIGNKKFISAEISRDAKVTDALRIMRADIRSAFQYRDIFCDLRKALKAKNQEPQPPAPPPEFQEANSAESTAEVKCAPKTTGFIGSSDALYFTALSNVRLVRDSQESDQAKIGYFLKTCTTFGGDSKPRTSQCLFRALSPILDKDIDQPGPAVPLVDHVEEFKLRYLGPDQSDYLDSWKSTSDGEAAMRDRFPYAVEITLTLRDRDDAKDRPVSRTILAPIAFENNIKKKPSPTPAAGGP